jgi:hypothetical protein
VPRRSAEVWDRLHRLVLNELSKEELIDWSRGCIDSVSARAKVGELTGRKPTDRGKPGTKYHLLVNAGGLILHTLLSTANIHDSMLFEPLLETNPGVRGHPPGRPRRRPDKLHADKGYDYPAAAVLPAARDQGPHRPPGHRVAEPSRSGSLGRRAQHLLAAAVQASRTALRVHTAHPSPAAHVGYVLINLRRLVQQES